MKLFILIFGASSIFLFGNAYNCHVLKTYIHDIGLQLLLLASISLQVVVHKEAER